MLSELQSSVRLHQRNMVEFAKTLIAIPSQNPPGARYDECSRVLRDRLRKLGFQCDSRIPEPCVRAVYGKGRRSLHFHGHYDVVPAASSAQFEPVVKAGKLFGRGSSDMKGGLAAMIYAARALKDSAVPLDGRLVLTFVPDEETGGSKGSGQ